MPRSCEALADTAGDLRRCSLLSRANATFASPVFPIRDGWLEPPELLRSQGLPLDARATSGNAPRSRNSAWAATAKVAGYIARAGLGARGCTLRYCHSVRKQKSSARKSGGSIH